MERSAGDQESARAGSDREPRLGYCAGICGPTVMQEYVLDQREQALGAGTGIPTRPSLDRQRRTVTVTPYQRDGFESIAYERFDDEDSVQILVDLTSLMPVEPEVRLVEGVCVIHLHRDDTTSTERVELPPDIERSSPPRWRITNDILEITFEKSAR